MVEMIVSHSGRDSSSSHIVAGVVFTHMPPDGAILPRHIRYKIRLQFANDTRTLFPYAKGRQGPRDATAWHGGNIRTTIFTRITYHFVYNSEVYSAASLFMVNGVVDYAYTMSAVTPRRHRTITATIIISISSPFQQPSQS